MNINHLTQIKNKIEADLGLAMQNLERLKGAHGMILKLIDVEKQITNDETVNEKDENLNPDLEIET